MSRVFWSTNIKIVLERIGEWLIQYKIGAASSIFLLGPILFGSQLSQRGGAYMIKQV